jgi:predicted O-methyltransferase YrrM
VGNLSIDHVLTSLRLRKYGLTRFMSVFSHTTPRERLGLFYIARRAPANARALEIGSQVGSSALFLCAGLKQKRGHLYCVDTWMNDTMPDGRHDNYRQFIENTKAFADMITPIRKRSETLSRSDFSGKLDLAFIDGNHDEEAVRSDFARVSELIKPGGVVALHDLNSYYPGVGIVIGEALASGNWQLLGYVDALGWIKKTK